nr:DNA cytosine methyltransferase [Neobacillus sp. Marseille-Q6967]
MNLRYSVGSLFAGVGGIDWGFKNTTFKGDSYNIVWANEIDEYAVETYRCNFPHTVFHGDIEKVVRPERAEDEAERNKYLQMQEDMLQQKIRYFSRRFPLPSLFNCWI